MPAGEHERGTAMEDELIRQYIEADPAAPVPERARIAGTGVTVAILISYLRGVGWDVARAAAAYEIPEQAVTAAHAFYHRHRARVDAWILANIAGAHAPTPT